MGDRTMRDAVARGEVEIDGARALARRFPDWMGTHPVLGAVAPASRA
jgi:hypothetical protein